MKKLIETELSGLVSAQQIPFIVSVSAFETGGFKSPVLRKNKNLFGMRLPVKRPTVAIGEKGGYSNYASFRNSVEDFYIWADYTEMPNVTSLKQFVREMKKRKYFEADFEHYYNGCLTWFNILYN